VAVTCARVWRSIVFGCLNLQLVATPKTPVRELDVWPDLPLFIHSFLDICPEESFENVVLLLKQSHRVCQISLDVPSSHLEEVLAAMQVPFPELTVLRLFFHDHGEMVSVGPVFHDSLLDGSAPRLQILHLAGIPFPGLPKLLFSANHLVDLQLQLPQYIPPETLVIALSTSTNLKILSLEFKFPPSRHDMESRRPPPPTRTVLPVLTFLELDGYSEYLDDLLARIDAPLLDNFNVTLFSQIVFETTQLTRFIGRTPNIKACEKAHVSFNDETSSVNLFTTPVSRGLLVAISCSELDQQLLSLEQVCTSILPSVSTSEDLYICEDPGWGTRLARQLRVREHAGQL
jgi:hypothetical protein